MNAELKAGIFEMISSDEIFDLRKILRFELVYVRKLLLAQILIWSFAALRAMLYLVINLMRTFS